MGIREKSGNIEENVILRHCQGISTDFTRYSWPSWEPKCSKRSRFSPLSCQFFLKVREKSGNCFENLNDHPVFDINLKGLHFMQ